MRRRRWRGVMKTIAQRHRRRCTGGDKIWQRVKSAHEIYRHTVELAMTVSSDMRGVLPPPRCDGSLHDRCCCLSVCMLFFEQDY